MGLAPNICKEKKQHKWGVTPPLPDTHDDHINEVVTSHVYDIPMNLGERSPLTLKLPKGVETTIVLLADPILDSYISYIPYYHISWLHPMTYPLKSPTKRQYPRLSPIPKPNTTPMNCWLYSLSGYEGAGPSILFPFTPETNLTLALRQASTGPK